MISRPPRQVRLGAGPAAREESPCCSHQAVAGPGEVRRRRRSRSRTEGRRSRFSSTGAKTTRRVLLAVAHGQIAVLMRRRIIADLIVFPAVPEDKAGLRFFVASCHSEEQIRLMVKALAEELKLLNAGGESPA